MISELQARAQTQPRPARRASRTGSIRLPAALLASFAAACTPSSEPAIATVALELEGVPDAVATLSVSVVDVEKDLVVTSSTITAPKTAFTLGVPAETPLEFRVIARTRRPGPAVIGAMPAYYGSTVRTIPLSSDQQRVALTVHRAGVLTVGTKLQPGVIDEEDQLALRVEAETPGVAPVLFTLAPLDPDLPRKQRTLVLRTGRYDALISDADAEHHRRPVIAGGRGLFVARELESVALLSIVTSSSASPRAPVALVLSLQDPGGAPLGANGVLATRDDADTEAILHLAAIDATGTEVGVTEAQLLVRLDAHPESLIARRPPDVSLPLPGALPGFAFRGSGRVRLLVTAQLPRGQSIDGELALNALVPGVLPERAESLQLSIDALDRLGEGTSFAIDLLDRRGLFAAVDTGFVDLSASDPWVFFADGPSSQIAAADRGHIRRRIARPSGPRGLPVVVRATVTSTPAAHTLTSSVVLPLLEIAP